MKSSLENNLENTGIFLFLGLIVFMTFKFMSLLTTVVKELALDSNAFGM